MEMVTLKIKVSPLDISIHNNVSLKEESKYNKLSNEDSDDDDDTENKGIVWLIIEFDVLYFFNRRR